MPFLRKAFMPGTKDPNGWENGYVEPQATYQNVGSQTPISHDRDGKPVKVEGRGMMKIPGYEWHNKSPEFHKLAGRVKDLLEDIGEKAEEIDPSFDITEDFEQLMVWAETENPPASLLQNPEKSARSFAVWRKTHKSAKRVSPKLAGRVKDLLQDIGEKAEEIDPSFDLAEDGAFEQLMVWAETENPPASLLQNPEKSAQNFTFWRKTHKSAKRVAARWASLSKRKS